MSLRGEESRAKHLCGVDSAYSRRWLRPAALWSGRADRYKLALWCCDALKAWQSPEKEHWAAAVRQRLHLKGSDVLVCECVSVELVGDVTQCPPTCSKHGPGPHMTPPSTCVCESLLPWTLSITHSVILQSQSWPNCWQLMIQCVSRSTINWITGLVGFSLWRTHLIKTIVKL